MAWSRALCDHGPAVRIGSATSRCVWLRRRMYHCLCCGYRTLPEQPPGTSWICAVCGWEDDDVQAADLDYPGGANHINLRDARETFQRIGAREKQKRER